MVVPSGKVVPEPGEQDAGPARPTVSLAVTFHVAAAPPGPVASRTWSPGVFRTGLVVSTIEYVAPACRVMPPPSV